MSNTVLYALWGVLYALCASLGFVTAPENSLRLIMSVLSVALFVPPFVLNYRAAKKNDCRTLKLVRNLALAWLVLAVILLVANFLSVLASEALGNVLYCLLIIVIINFRTQGIMGERELSISGLREYARKAQIKAKGGK